MLSAILIGRMKKPEMEYEEENEKEEGEEGEGYEKQKMEVASKLMAALKSDDKESFASNLSEFIKLCD